jgi:hypothetical protein
MDRVKDITVFKQISNNFGTAKSFFFMKSISHPVARYCKGNKGKLKQFQG